MDVSLWSMWDGIHDADDQRKRLSSARLSENTPVFISDDGIGTFQGRHGSYETHLDKCSCVDFLRRKKPCKHMYRLAIDIGAIQDKADQDKTKIKRKIPDGRSLRDLVCSLENMEESAQLYLKDVLLNMLFRKKDPIKLKDRKELCSIIDAGFIVPVKDMYTINDDARKRIRKLYTYLIRKFDTECWLDIDTGKEKTVPKGSLIELSYELETSNTTLSICFPDDEVTDLLNIFGANRCNNWTI